MTSNRVDSPICLIGMPRSGTSIVYEALVNHPDLGWPPHHLNFFPQLPELCIVNRFFSAPGQKQQRGKVSLLKKFTPRPDEMYPVWNYLVGEQFLFSFLRDDQPSNVTISKVQNYFKRMLRAEGKKRLALKLTGPPRMQYLSAIFPDARFIEITRDPRAVVASLLKVNFWQRTKESADAFWHDALSEAQIAACRSDENTAAALTAAQCVAVAEQIRNESNRITGAFMSVAYEDFVANPNETMSLILDFGQLSPSNKLAKFIEKKTFHNMNAQNILSLSDSEIATIERICSPLMSRPH